MRYRNFSITNVGKVRSANEDNYGEANTPNGHLFVVCDGMGGHVGGAKASSIAVASIIEYFQREKHSNIIQAIDRAFSFANEQIFANALSSPELKGMGTTSVVLIVSGDDCYIGHVGDSRIYLKSNNRLHRVTKDHSFVQTLVDSGVISDDEAESHPNKNQILKALGTSSIVEGTICQVPLQVKAGDVFLLCSDGLNGMVNDKGLEMMLQGQNLAQSGEDLIRAALDAGGLDNITATMVAIDENSYLSSKFVDFNPIKKFDASSTQSFMTPPNSTKSSRMLSTKGIVLLSVFVLSIGILGFVFLNGGGGELPKKELGMKNEEVDPKPSEPTELPSNSIDVKEPKKNQDPLKEKNESKKDTENAEKVEKENKEVNEIKEIKDVKENIEVKENKVSNDVKISENNKGKKSKAPEIQYNVKKGDNLGAIVLSYKARYPKLTESSVISYNQSHNKNYKGVDGEKLETEKIIKEGKVLLIPTE